MFGKEKIELIEKAGRYAIRKGSKYLDLASAVRVYWWSYNSQYFRDCWVSTEKEAMKTYERLFAEEKVIKVLNCKCNQAKTEGK